MNFPILYREESALNVEQDVHIILFFLETSLNLLMILVTHTHKV